MKVLAYSLGKQIEFTTKQVVICTNAFAQQFIPAVDITPGRGQILVTEQITVLPFKGTFHYDEGFYYFRNVGNRILLGGGRNLDFSGEKTTEIELSTTIQDALVNLLQTVIFPKADLKIEQRWAGIMAFGQEKSPIVSRVSENVFCAVRGGGMGVALASNTAIEAVDLLTES